MTARVAPVQSRALPSRPALSRRVAIPVLGVAGILVSGYLTYVHYSGTTALCVGVGGCEVVNTSRYSEIMGVPVALLGLGMYVAVLTLGIAVLRASEGLASQLVMAIVGLCLAGFLFSAYLTYIELFVLYAVCPWCVTSAAIVTALLGLSAWDLWAA